MMIKNILNTVFIFLIIFLLSSVAIANDNSLFSRIDSDQGLPPGNVNEILQDSLGFIWIGTESGLARYDGYNFKIYKNIRNDSTSISYNNIFTMLIEGNTIWIGTLGGGLNKFDIRTEKFVKYIHNPKDSTSISNNNIYKIFRDSKKRIWITTLGGGLNEFNPQTGKFKRYQHNQEDDLSISSNMASAIYEDYNNNLWIGTFDKGLNIFSPSVGKFKRITKDDKNGLNHNQIMEIVKYNKDELLVATFGGGINIYNFNNKRFENFSNTKNFIFDTKYKLIRKVYEDLYYIWIATHIGLSRYNKSNGVIKRFETKKNDPNTLINNSIREIYADKSGLIWIGTNYGINTYDYHRKKFHYVKFEDARDNLFLLPGGICNENIRWAGKINYPSKRKLKYYGNAKYKGIIKNLNSVNHYVDEENVLWIGNYQGIKYFDEKEKEFTYLELNLDKENKLQNDFMKVYYYDRSGDFWFGSLAGGLNKVNAKNGEIKRYVHNEENSKSISDSRVNVIYEDMFGIFWVGTFGGLNVMDRQNANFSHYTYSPGDTSGISNERILSIYETKKGDLWIGTYQGLNKFDRYKNRFKQYTKNDGLEGNTIYNIIEAEDGKLWLGTEKGISVLDPITNVVKNYNTSDGLKEIESDGSFSFVDRNGKFYFGANKGFNTFYPNEIIDHTYIPQIVLTSLKIMNEEIIYGKNSNIDKPINELDVIELSYKDRIIELEFSALHYAIPSKNKYAYIIENYSDKWNYVSSNDRKIVLTNLQAGEYIIRINGSNSDGLWNNVGKTIKIVISPPYYETWWFRLSGVILFLVIIFIIYEYRLQRLMEVERTRSRIARNLHDEVGGTLASIQYFVNAIRKNTDRNSKEKFLNLITDSSNDAQEKIRDIIWTVNPDEDGLTKFFVKFNRYASDLFDTNEIEYNIEFPDKEIEKNIDMEKRQHLWCICKETVTNTVKHSNCKSVNIKFEIKGNDLIYTIEDDGVGVEKNNYNIGNGLRNINNRAQLIKADYQIDSDKNEGFKFNLTFRF